MIVHGHATRQVLIVVCKRPGALSMRSALCLPRTRAAAPRDGCFPHRLIRHHHAPRWASLLPRNFFCGIRSPLDGLSALDAGLALLQTAEKDREAAERFCRFFPRQVLTRSRA